MDLIDRIKSTLSDNIGLESPIFDIYFDNQKNIVGYVADKIFETKNDEESQKLIWDALRKNYGQDELKNILMIFHETPKERAERLIGYSKTTTHSNFWLHITPELAKYWLFIDVTKIGDNYKSFFLIINAKENFKKGDIFDYNKEVIEFMEMDDSEIYNELYFSALNNAESEIKFDLMKKYEELTKKNLWGSQNRFDYVFKNFELIQVSKVQLKFSNEEVSILTELLKPLNEFRVKQDIERAIEISKTINELSIDVTKAFNSSAA